MNTETPSEQDQPIALAVVSALLTQYQSTSDTLLDITSEDALHWKEKYVELTEMLNDYVKTGNIGHFMDILHEANFNAHLAQEEIQYSVSSF
jgi:hypothetical protein